MTNIQPDLLAGLAPDDAAAVMALGSAVSLHAGDVLFRLGGDADCVYLIRRGRIALTLPMQIGGHEQDVLIEERVPGQTLGWSALIPPHRFTLKATAPLETELLAFSRNQLVDYFTAHPGIGYAVAMNVAAVIGQRLQVFQAMWLREMQRVVTHAHA